MTDKNLLVTIQKGIPLTRNPFAVMADELSLSEADVITQLNSLFDSGTARRFGAVFDLRRLGYLSALCAVTLTENEFDAVIPQLIPHNGITHCYLRGWPEELDQNIPGGPCGAPTPNIWFTLAGLSDSFESELAAVRKTVQPHNLLVLPAVRRFKIDVIFDPRTRERSELVPPISPQRCTHSEHDEVPHTFTEQEKTVVRLLQDSLPVCAAPFDEIAAKTGYAVEDLLKLLQEWQQTGVLRRLAVILRHHKVGFKANGMCVWRVPEDRATAVGRSLASLPEVTHCYQREITDDFPYNVYAMIHTGCWDDTVKLFQRISRVTGLEGGRILCSLQEFKKTSPRYFCENEKDTTI